MECSNRSSDEESAETVEVTLNEKERENSETNRILTTGPSSSSGENAAGVNPNEVYNRSIDPKDSRSYQLEPEVGMVFRSEDQAYSFYSKYAYRKGFSVRKGHLGRRKDGSIRNRVFLCSNEGARQKHATHLTKKPRDAVRTNCMARIEYKVSGDGIWVVSKVIYEHNHPLVRPHKAHLLRSHRKTLQSQHDGMDEAAGEKPTECIEFASEDAHDAQTIGFVFKDQSSYLHTNRMRELESGDAQCLLEFLKAKQLEDPSFFYAVQLDDREQVTNFFWADARSVIDYMYFGDVVLFDTTYRASKSDIPFAPFIGVNHHKQIVTFGNALLLDETTESFVWLFRTFMVAMSGRQPKTIFTDHCAAVSRAVNMTLTETCHRLCLWHITHNSSVHISHPYSADTNFQKDFKDAVYEYGTEEEFVSRWVALIQKYDLLGNSWLEDVYAVRDRWALVYPINSFVASMTTVQWHESIKNLFKKHFNRKLPLSKFLEQYNKTLIHFRAKELYEDYKSRQTKPVLLVDMPMLNEAAASYTRLMYNDFEEEFKSQLSCVCEPIGTDGTVYTYKIALPGKHSFGIVELNTCNFAVACSCRKFESMGILCMHTLKVFNHNNILHLPNDYILKRWTKYANVEVISDKHQSVPESNSQDLLATQYSRVCQKAITIAVKSAFSEDALQIFDQELDKLMAHVEHILHVAPLSRQTEDGDVVIHDVNQGDILEASKKKRGRRGQTKDGNDVRQKKNPELTSNSTNTVTTNQPSLPTEDLRQSHIATGRVMIDEPASITSYSRDGAPSYYNSMPMQPSVCTSFPLEAVIPTQETFASSQTLLDNTMSSSQVANNHNLPWSTAGGSVGVPMHVMRGQPNNFLSWVVQAQSIPNADLLQHRPDQSMQQPLSRKLTFDINKGN